MFVNLGLLSSMAMGNILFFITFHIILLGFGVLLGGRQAKLASQDDGIPGRHRAHTRQALAHNPGCLFLIFSLPLPFPA